MLNYHNLIQDCAFPPQNEDRLWPLSNMEKLLDGTKIELFLFSLSFIIYAYNYSLVLCSLTVLPFHTKHYKLLSFQDFWDSRWTWNLRVCSSAHFFPVLMSIIGSLFYFPCDLWLISIVTLDIRSSQICYFSGSVSPLTESLASYTGFLAHSILIHPTAIMYAPQIQRKIRQWILILWILPEGLSGVQRRVKIASVHNSELTWVSLEYVYGSKVGTKANIPMLSSFSNAEQWRLYHRRSF